MIEFERYRHRRIRQLYYLSNFFILLLTVGLLSFLYFRGLKVEYTKSVEQLKASIIEQKSIYIKSVIDEKISDIEQIKIFYETESHKKARMIIHYIKDSIEDLSIKNIPVQIPPLYNNYLNYTGLESFDYMISYRGQLLSTSLGQDKNPESEQEFPVRESLSLDNGFTITVLLSAEVGDRELKKCAERLIRDAVLPTGGYIWVNWILDYSGGTNYAIRLIHPNLKETEGQYLDTSTRDIKGNKPFLLELEGINRDGEVYYEYFFKKLNSDDVEHKLSFARLYKPFDWVIATGIYLDDIDTLVQQEKGYIQSSLTKEVTRTSILIILCSIFSAIMIVTFERQIRKRIKELTGRIEEMAFEDSLTGLLNRRAMLNHLQQEISRFRRGTSTFSVIMFDIDLFKKVNDTYGHPMGDEVIKNIARILKDNIRFEDKAGRWGGEEFLLLITDSTLEKGVAAAEKIRKVVEAETIEHDGESLTVTITAGVACFRKDDDLDQVVARADENLYQGKESGRNCVVSERD